MLSRRWSYLVEVLALELGNELVKALGVGLNANGLKDGLDISGRGGGVATEGEEEVSGQVLHFVCLEGCVVRRKSYGCGRLDQKLTELENQRCQSSLTAELWRRKTLLRFLGVEVHCFGKKFADGTRSRIIFTISFL